MIGHRFIVSRLLGLTILIAVLIGFSQRLTRKWQAPLLEVCLKRFEQKGEKIGSS
jgi:hypothetical protein